VTLVPDLVKLVDPLTGLYQDAARTTPVAALDDPIGGIEDLSGAGNHDSQSDNAKRLIYKPDFVGDNPAIYGDGVGWMSSPGPVYPGDHTIFMVVQKGAAAGNDVILGPSLADPVQYVAYTYTNGIVYYNDGGSANTVNGGLPADTLTLFESNRSANFWQGVKNGENKTADSGAVAGLTQYQKNLFAWKDGTGASGVANFHGHLLFLACFDRVLTTGEFSAVRNYLAARFGLTLVTPPGAPQSVEAWNHGDGQIIVTWAAPTGDVSSYNLYRGTAPGVLTLVQEGILETSVVDYDRVNGTTYYYAVTAENGIGESEQSDEVSASSAVLPDEIPATDAFELGLDNTAAYQDAARTIPVDGAGQTVAAYTDLSGNGRHATVLSGAAEGLSLLAPYDGKLAVRMNDTVFAVTNPPSVGTFVVFTVLWRNLQDSNWRVMLGDGTNKTILSEVGSGLRVWPAGDLPPLVSSDPLMIRVRQVSEQHRSGTVWRCYANGRQVDSPVTVDAGAFSLARLGGQAPGANTWDGDHFATYLFSRELNPTELAQMRQYLRTHWGCPGPASFSLIGVPEGIFNFNSFPSAFLASNGKVYCFHYRNQGGEGPTTGMGLIRENDGDLTDFHKVIWTHNEINYDDSGNLGAAEMSTGRCLFPYGGYGGTPYRFQRLYYTDDFGATMSSVEIDVPAGYSYVVPYGLPIELAADNWLLPVYGPNTASGFNDSLLLQSTDEGLTWTLYAVVMAGSGIATDYNETSIVHLGGGAMVAVARVGTFGDLYQATSGDYGLTWTAPAAQSMGTNLISPCLIVLANGNLVLTAGDRGALSGIPAWRSTNGGASWSARKELFDPPLGSGSMGYPATMQLPGGQLFTVLQDDLARVIGVGRTESELFD
jgi:hypothetical protein